MKKLLYFCLILLCSVVGAAQNRTITGVVKNEKGEPIADASVVVKNSTIGTTTNSAGVFSLVVNSNVNTITVSSVGLAPQDLSVSNSSKVDVVLTAIDKDLQEVLVVAYGTAKKRTFTGSASTIRSEDIGKLQISTFTRALEGMVPGIQVTSTSGQPGKGSVIRIRGVGSINASAEPLYVVDGVPYGGDFNSINASDIESISVLKDAASTALYGARGANGVILITTKRGRGKAKVDLQTRWGTNQRGVPEYDVIKNPAEFLETMWLSLRNEAMFRTTGPLTPQEAGVYASQSLFDVAHLNNYKQYSVPAGQTVIDPVTGKLNANANLLYYDDWDKVMYNNNDRQEHLVTVSGSSDKTQYYLSVGYLRDKGYIVKSDFNRFTTRLRLDQKINSWLNAGINLTYAKSTQNNTEEGDATYQNSFFFTRNISPAYPVWVRDAQGATVLDNKGNPVYDFGSGVASGSMGTRTFAGTDNVRATLDLDVNKREGFNTSSRAYVVLTPVKDLAITLNHGIDLKNSENIAFQNPSFGNAAGVQGRSIITNGRELTENINQLINYKPSFGDHNFDLLLGHESYKLTWKEMESQKELFLFPTDPDLGGGAVLNEATSNTDLYTVEGFFSQLRYDFKNKYFISGSIRRDGSSRFAPDHKWGNFWSTGFGWNLTSEKFMEGLKFLNLLRLKFSIGDKGNDDLNYVGSSLTGTNYYPYANQYTVSSTGSANLTIAYRGNENITWEKNRDINYGIEFGLFNQRISGSFEIFKRTTTDLLFPRPLAFSTGIQSIPANIGDMYNKGFEGELTFQVVRSKAVRWSIFLNGTHWYNKLTRLPPENQEKGITTGNFKYLPGHSIYEFFTWSYAGVDQATGLSFWHKDQLDATGKPTGTRLITSDFNEATRYYTGKSATPDVTGGAGTQVSYRGFDLSVLTSFGIGGWVYDAPYQGLMYAGGGDISTWHRDIANAWAPGQSKNTSVPMLQENYQNANATSDRWLIKADYWNLRNITMGYTLQENMLEKLSITAIRFYLAADNVSLNSRRQGLDPRQDFSGGVFNAYSPIRTISAGLNVTF